MAVRVRERIVGAVHDPGHTSLRKAVRAAIIVPALLALGSEVIGDDILALFAAFGAFAALALADFAGPNPRRFGAYLGFGVAGGLLVLVGTVLSDTTWEAAVAMLLIGFGVQLAGVLGGYILTGASPAILAFALAVMVPSPTSDLGARELGWLLSAVVAAFAAILLWPRHQRAVVRDDIAAACRSLSALVSPDDTSDLDARRAAAAAGVAAVGPAAIFAVNRPAGPSARDQAMLALAHQLTTSYSLAGDNVEAEHGPIPDRRDELARAVARAFAESADALGDTGSPPDVLALDGAVRAFRVAVHEWARDGVRAATPSADVIRDLEYSFPLRALAHNAMGVTVNSAITAGLPIDTSSLTATNAVAIPEAGRRASLRRGWSMLRAQFQPGSVWFRNSLRAALALSIAVLIAKVADLNHAFWVVLGVLSALRSNALSTSATVLQALSGTVLGFVLVSVGILVWGGDTTVGWIILPITVFLAAYTPTAVHYVIGQASFTLFVVVLFNILEPAGFQTGIIRVEDIAIGGAVAIVVGLLFWPRGAKGALARAVADELRAASSYLSGAFARVFGGDRDLDLAPAHAAAIETRAREEDAFSQLLGERGRSVPVDAWSALTSTAARARVAALTLADVTAATVDDDAFAGCTALLMDQASSVETELDVLASKLTHDATAAPPTVDDAVVPRALAQCVGTAGGAHVDDALVLVWTSDWLRFLRAQSAVADAHIDEIVDRLDAPWWR